MAAVVKSTAVQKARRCDCEQMLRQQHAQTPMSGKSASYQFVHRAANGRNRRALLSLVGQIKLSDSASAIYPHQLDDDIDRLLNVLPHLSEVQRRARLQDHYC